MPLEMVPGLVLSTSELAELNLFPAHTQQLQETDGSTLPSRASSVGRCSFCLEATGKGGFEPVVPTHMRDLPLLMRTQLAHAVPCE